MRCPKCLKTSELDNLHLLDRSFKREWVGLTDEDIEKVCGFGEYTTTSTRITFTHLSKAIEAKLKEKNT